MLNFIKSKFAKMQKFFKKGKFMYRFAPSPTGDMHIGNLRAALINFICAKKEKTGFILRIEDTDASRDIEGKENEIQDLLKKFGISWDYFYIQSQNLTFHRQMASKLLAEKKAFLCFCSEEILAQKKEIAKAKNEAYRYDETCANLSDEEVLNNPNPAVVRIKKPTGDLSFTDLIKGELKFDAKNFDSFVLMRADKTPTYNFACAVDDMLEGVTCVIRGEDHVTNTPKQNHIRKSLGFEGEIKYAHLPIILNMQGKKMSKREKDSSVQNLLEMGFLPEAIANYLLLLGNQTPKEIFTIFEAIEFFDLSKISKSPAKFDIDKLRQINREHIRLASNERICEIFKVGKNLVDLVKFYTQESSLIGEIKEKVEMIFDKNRNFGEFEEEAKILKDQIQKIEILPQNFDEFKEILMKNSGFKGKKFFMPLRILLTNSPHGPELKELYPLLKDKIKEIF